MINNTHWLQLKQVQSSRIFILLWSFLLLPLWNGSKASQFWGILWELKFQDMVTSMQLFLSWYRYTSSQIFNSVACNSWPKKKNLVSLKYSESLCLLIIPQLFLLFVYINNLNQEKNADRWKQVLHVWSGLWGLIWNRSKCSLASCENVEWFYCTFHPPVWFPSL